ncbi:unnamed protein product [Schistocephalus solidus]|uniref:Velvet domain-containing protein n=1 Tax=Schistocephalus solidus TaxID=70667 RepID=A0A183SRL4_SCHSO|nr:unnamed protein product [Schistocephalus solidus]
MIELSTSWELQGRRKLSDVLAIREVHLDELEFQGAGSPLTCDTSKEFTTPAVVLQPFLHPEFPSSGACCILIRLATHRRLRIVQLVVVSSSPHVDLVDRYGEPLAHVEGVCACPGTSCYVSTQLATTSDGETLFYCCSGRLSPHIECVVRGVCAKLSPWLGDCFMSLDVSCSTCDGHLLSLVLILTLHYLKRICRMGLRPAPNFSETQNQKPLVIRHIGVYTTVIAADSLAETGEAHAQELIQLSSYVGSADQVTRGSWPRSHGSASSTSSGTAVLLPSPKPIGRTLQLSQSSSFATTTMPPTIQSNLSAWRTSSPQNSSLPDLCTQLLSNSFSNSPDDFWQPFVFLQSFWGVRTPTFDRLDIAFASEKSGRSIGVALASACVDAEDSGPLQDFRVRDPVLPSQFQYSAEAAEIEMIQLPDLVRVDGPGLRSAKE